MIQANELMLDNWVLESGIPTRIIAIDKTQCYTWQLRWTATANLQPIPLTPEIMLQCGFVKNNKQFIRVYNEQGNIITINDILGVLTLSSYDVELSSLHQLQNLYFSLTGTPLIIDLNQKK